MHGKLATKNIVDAVAYSIETVFAICADLVSGESMPIAPEVDDALTLAGLVRPVRAHGGGHVELRAPAIATLLK